MYTAYPQVAAARGGVHPLVQHGKLELRPRTPTFLFFAYKRLSRRIRGSLMRFFTGSSFSSSVRSSGQAGKHTKGVWQGPHGSPGRRRHMGT